MHTVIRLLAAAAIALAAAGCGTSPRQASGDAPATAAKPTPEQRIAPAVALPAPAAKKVVLYLTGPKSVVDHKDWPDFRNEWRSTFNDYAKESGITLMAADAEPKPTGEDGTVLTVNVSDFRTVSIAQRVMLGIMIGNAFIEAKVQFASLKDGAVFGEQPYSTKSSLSGGVFAKTTPQQVDAIVQNVFIDLKAAKAKS